MRRALGVQSLMGDVGRHLIDLPQLPYQEHGLQVWAAHVVARRAARLAAQEGLKDLVPAYVAAFEALASSLRRVEGRISAVTELSPRRSAILANYISGTTLVESAILDGYNTQAAALVRQELEGIAALEELRNGQRRERRTPNVRNVPSIPGAIYSDLSAAAHLSCTGFLRALAAHSGNLVNAPGITEAPMLTPQYRPEFARRLFGVHTLLLIHLVEHHDLHNVDLHGVEATDVEAGLAAKALELLVRCGVVEVRDAGQQNIG